MRVEYERTIGVELVEFIKQLSYGDLPSSVIEHAKWLILDLIGVAIAGESHPAARSVSSMLSAHAMSGGSTAINYPRAVDSPWAAFANAAYAQVHDANDGHMMAGALGGYSHPGRIVVPVAFALGEESGASGRELLVATVIGYEVLCRVRGRNPKPPVGGYGAAAVGARLLGLSTGQSLDAMGMAGHLHPINMQYLTGSDANHIMSGYLARLGVECCYLAQFGASGPNIYDDRVLTTRYRVRGLGSEYEILNTYTKPYPTCRETHAAIDAILQLRSGVDDPIRDVKEIRIQLPSRAMYVTEPVITAQSSHKSCQFSLAYAVAAALLDGHVGMQQFAPGRIANEDVQELLRRVIVTADDRLDALYTTAESDLFAPRPAVVVLIMTNGEIHTKEILYPLGHPRNPLSHEQRLTRFREMCIPSFGGDVAVQVEERLSHFEQGFARDVMLLLTGEEKNSTCSSVTRGS